MRQFNENNNPLFTNFIMARDDKQYDRDSAEAKYDNSSNWEK